MADDLNNQNLDVQATEEENQADFDEVFDLHAAENPDTESADDSSQASSDSQNEPVATTQQEPTEQQVLDDQSQVQQEQNYIQPQQPVQPPVQQQVQPNELQLIDTRKPPVKLSEDLQGEYDKLKRISPYAANLALEDSPDGERIRSRLEEFGAEIAFDRAEAIYNKRYSFFSRQREQATYNAEQVRKHNENFRSTIRQRSPDYFDMMTNANRQQEAQNFLSDVYAWIGTKPYDEGAKLMQVAKNGRDPNKICDLIDQYYKERGKNPRASVRHDPTGALAVPSRGSVSTVAGVGDKDSFDAGWSIHEHESNRR